MKAPWKQPLYSIFAVGKKKVVFSKSESGFLGSVFQSVLCQPCLNGSFCTVPGGAKTCLFWNLQAERIVERVWAWGYRGPTTPLPAMKGPSNDPLPPARKDNPAEVFCAELCCMKEKKVPPPPFCTFSIIPLCDTHTTSWLWETARAFDWPSEMTSHPHFIIGV